MAKIVVAGKADCPFYAIAEFLGDKLATNLPDFKFNKIVKTSSEWQDWLQEICKKNDWHHTRSPIIWRELVDRGGKGTLIGGVNEFQEYAYGYYGVTINMSSHDAKIISKENEKTKEMLDYEQKEFADKYDPLYVCITNASNPICFALVGYLLSGDILSPEKDIVLNLFEDNPINIEILEGVAEDIMDMGYGSLKENVRVTQDLEKALQGCKIVIFLDKIPRSVEEEKQAWLQKISEVFTYYGQVLNRVADHNVKVFVGGEGNINLQTCILIESAPNIQKKNIVGVSRYLEFHAKSVLAQALKINSAYIADLAIWGNLHQTYLIDLQKSRVYELDCSIVGSASYSLPLVDMIFKEKWLKHQYTIMVQSRKRIVERQLKHPEYNLYARAIALTLRDCWSGSTSNNFFSLAVASEGWYGIPEGIVFSLPVHMSTTGGYNVVEDYDLLPEFEEQLKPIIEELILEKRSAAGEIIPEKEKEAEKAETEVTEITDEAFTEEALPESTLDSVTGATPDDQEKTFEEGEDDGGEEEEVDEETIGSTFEATISSTVDYTEGTTEGTSAVGTSEYLEEGETKSDDQSVETEG